MKKHLLVLIGLLTAVMFNPCTAHAETLDDGGIRNVFEIMQEAMNDQTKMVDFLKTRLASNYVGKATMTTQLQNSAKQIKTVNLTRQEVIDQHVRCADEPKCRTAAASAKIEIKSVILSPDKKFATVKESMTGDPVALQVLGKDNKPQIHYASVREDSTFIVTLVGDLIEISQGQYEEFITSTN